MHYHEQLCMFFYCSLLDQFREMGVHLVVYVLLLFIVRPVQRDGGSFGLVSHFLLDLVTLTL